MTKITVCELCGNIIRDGEVVEFAMARRKKQNHYDKNGNIVKRGLLLGSVDDRVLFSTHDVCERCSHIIFFIFKYRKQGVLSSLKELEERFNLDTDDLFPEDYK